MQMSEDDLMWEEPAAAAESIFPNMGLEKEGSSYIQGRQYGMLIGALSWVHPIISNAFGSMNQITKCTVWKWEHNIFFNNCTKKWGSYRQLITAYTLVWRVHIVHFYCFVITSSCLSCLATFLLCDNLLSHCFTGKKNTRTASCPWKH